jgi:hypothetical protein
MILNPPLDGIETYAIVCCELTCEIPYRKYHVVENESNVLIQGPVPRHHFRKS